MSNKQMLRAQNGSGSAAKVAAKRWARRQTLTQGAYDGPVRLLSLIVAIGVPLGCYGLAEAHVGRWWPLLVGILTPALVLGMKWLAEHVSTKRDRAAHPHPLRMSTSSD